MVFILDNQLLRELQEYVNDHLNIPELDFAQAPKNMEDIFEDIYHEDIEDFMKDKRKPTFNQLLFSFIDQQGAKDSDIYKKAGIDRRHFSKIRAHLNYKPRKNTVIALALALELNKAETIELLDAAGYALSDSDTYDLVIQFCLEKKIYDIHLVNQALNYYGLGQLIGVN